MASSSPGVGNVAGTDEHGSALDDASVGERHARQLVGVDDEANDFAVDHSDATAASCARSVADTSRV